MAKRSLLSRCPSYNLWDPIFIIQVIISIKFLFPKSGIFIAGFPWFSSFNPDKFWDSTYNNMTPTSVYIVANTLITLPTEIIKNHNQAY